MVTTVTTVTTFRGLSWAIAFEQCFPSTMRLLSTITLPMDRVTFVLIAAEVVVFGEDETDTAAVANLVALKSTNNTR
jgi:hypothetical protein